MVFFVVFDADNRPFLVTEIKDDSWARNTGSRFEADQQLRRWYDAMFDACPLPRLWVCPALHSAFTVEMLSPEPLHRRTKVAPTKIAFSRQGSWKMNEICISSRRRNSTK